MARAERNEEKNVKNYNYEWQTDEEIVANAHTKIPSRKIWYNINNIGTGDFVCFGVKGLMDTNKRLKDAMLFNILSYMSDRLLGEGNTAASVDELYLFLTNMTAIEYIRNAMKRVRKKDRGHCLYAVCQKQDFRYAVIR